MPKMKADVIYRKAPPLSDPTCIYPGFCRKDFVLKAGTQVKRGHAPLTSDVLCQLDVGIRVRDGVTLYADIFRPVGDQKVPAILNSTTFGKRKIRLDGELPIPEADPLSPESVAGVPRGLTSGLETFEGTDPGWWVPHDYAVINLDIRGCYMSEGKGQYFGTQEAEDDYDVIEWLAAQPWCSGAVTMTGNSWLGIDQWFAAAECPPHLTCLAPWEGWYDMYRDEYMVGGVPNYPGFRFNNSYSDKEWMEDVIANCLEHPLFDDYWEDKAAKVENITVPLYVTASYDSPFHTQGTFMAWRKSASTEKWLRVHDTQEWGDTYRNADDMLKFFDYYMKDKKDNGWEKTPRVRLSVFDMGNTDVVERPEEDFPLARQEDKAMYLNARDMSLSFDKPAEHDTVKYNGTNGEVVKFSYTFDTDAEIVGYMNLKLWVESEGFNDLDLFVQVRKIGADGETKLHYCVPGNLELHGGGWAGPNTRMRASLRKLDPARSTENEPYHTFDEFQKLRPYDVVPVEIGIFPCGLRYHKGETLELNISGRKLAWLPAMGAMEMGIINNGNHILHTGGEYDAKLIVPFIPYED